jgi:hypothetical protein
MPLLNTPVLNHTVRGYGEAMSTWEPAALEALIEEATVDAYGEDERLTGFWTCRCRNPPPRARNGSRHTATGPAELARRTTAQLGPCSNGQSPRLPLTGPTAGNKEHVVRIPQYACRYG